MKLLFLLCTLPMVHGQSIRVSTDLDCDFEALFPCRWRNGTDGVEDDFDFGIESAVILDSWHSIPRSKDGRGDTFAYARGSFARKNDDVALLISDPIPCQLGTGKLNFWFWKTAHLPSLQLCIQQDRTLRCFETIHGIHRQEWVLKSVEIPQQLEPFQLVFRSTFKHSFDIVGLDEVTYEANISDTLTCQSLALDIRKEDSISERGWNRVRRNARFFEPPRGETNWINPLIQATRRRRPRPMLIVAQEVEPPPPPTTSPSPPTTQPIPPQKDTEKGFRGSLNPFGTPVSFSLFPGTGEGTKLDFFSMIRQVAPLLPLLAPPAQPPSFEYESKIRAIDYEDQLRSQVQEIDPRHIRLPPPPDFELVRPVQFSDGIARDLSGVPQGESQGGFPPAAGPSTTVRTNSGNQGSTRRPSPPRGGGSSPGVQSAQNACPQVNCDFDNSNLCRYETGARATSIQLPPDALSREWRLSDRQVANSLTGIFSDAGQRGGMYAYAGLTDEKPDVFVLSTAQFSTEEDAVLDFSFYMAGIEGRFAVCVDDLTNCPFESLGKHIKADARRWRDGSIRIPSGTQTIHFLVDQLQKNYVVGIDEIRLRDPVNPAIGTNCF